MWLPKQCLSGPVLFVIKARVAMLTETAMAQEGYLTSFSAIVNYLHRQYATDDNIAIVDANFDIFKQQDMTATD